MKQKRRRWDFVIFTVLGSILVFLFLDWRNKNEISREFQELFSNFVSHPSINDCDSVSKFLQKYPLKNRSIDCNHFINDLKVDSLEKHSNTFIDNISSIEKEYRTNRTIAQVWMVVGSFALSIIRFFAGKYIEKRFKDEEISA
jgi:hypothetical protein